MQKLQTYCAATGGRKLAAEWVEKAFVGTVEHLIDLDYVEKAKKINFCYSLLFIIFLIAQFGVLIWLIIEKSKRNNL